MPKENTHLSFAIKTTDTEGQISEIVKRNIKYLYLGSIFPDTFYYSKKSEVQHISDIIHGKNSNPTNKLIFDLLDIARENKDEQLLVFTMGFITHCYLDIVFHPVIFYLTGNFYDEDYTKRELAIYKHRRMEVVLDQKVNTEFYYKKLIDKTLFKNKALQKALSKCLGVEGVHTEASMNRQHRMNLLFHKRFLLPLLIFLNKIRIYNNKDNISLFYGNLIDDESLNGESEYRDLFNGEVKRTTILELFNIAELKTKDALYSAYRYYNREESLEIAQMSISGESLDTGSKTFSVEQIKFIKQ